MTVEFAISERLASIAAPFSVARKGNKVSINMANCAWRFYKILAT